MRGAPRTSRSGLEILGRSDTRDGSPAARISVQDRGVGLGWRNTVTETEPALSLSTRVPAPRRLSAKSVCSSYPQNRDWEVTAMTTEMRKSGIDVVGDIPWGTHFCLFYETK